ncbi:VWA domain-containing protein [Jatrophihabitans fulvus]
MVAALAAVYAVLQVRRKRYVARFSNVALLGSVAPRRPGWRRHLTFALLLIGLATLSVGVAKPSKAVKVPRENATVMLAIDVSLSMKATDVLPSRIETAKTAGKQFADLLPPRINLGLLSFARAASVIVAPTVNREQVKKGIDSLKLQNYTAIGEAIFGSLQAIDVYTKSTLAQGSKPPPRRIVLLSDGTNTVGRSVTSAIAAARKDKVQVSTIAFGTPNGTVTDQGQTVLVPADNTTLNRIARETGGSFHTAASESELRDVYSDIGSQIGYTTEKRDISWGFMLTGLLVLFAAGGTAMLWSGRLV